MNYTFTGATLIALLSTAGTVAAADVSAPVNNDDATLSDIIATGPLDRLRADGRAGPSRRFRYTNASRAADLIRASPE